MEGRGFDSRRCGFFSAKLVRDLLPTRHKAAQELRKCASEYATHVTLNRGITQHREEFDDYDSDNISNANPVLEKDELL